MCVYICIVTRLTVQGLPSIRVYMYAYYMYVCINVHRCIYMCTRKCSTQQERVKNRS